MDHPAQPRSAPPTPERILQLSWGFTLTHALTSAVELGLFTHIAGGATTRAAIAKAAGASRRGTDMLLDALVALGLLTRAGDGEKSVFALAPDAAAFLVKTSPAYLGDFVVLHTRTILPVWNGLTESARTGKPQQALDVPKEGAGLWDELVPALFNLSWLAGTQLGQELKRRLPGRALHLLDVAAGSGVWGFAAASVDPTWRVTTFDLAETLPHAKRFAERLKMTSRVELVAGDLRSHDFGAARYDAAILGHIVHSEGAMHGPHLIAKMAKALKPGGVLAIPDFVPDADRRGPPMPLLFALNMLVNTNEGSTYTFSEYEAWCRAAGFREVTSFPCASVSPLILAVR
jgi:ubiquinone/menaquinone biosynthesis C-methylase UbiE